MVQTIKFSQFSTANLSDSSNQLVGLSGSNNSRIKNVVTWTTLTRPSAPYNGLMGFNTDLELYEYYNSNLAEWVQFSSSGDVSQIYARLAAHTLGDGASLIGLQNEGSSVVNQTVQNLALASFIVNTNNGSMLNAQALGDLSSGILKNTTTTGILSISQPLTSIDGLTTVANNMLYLTAPNVYGVLSTTEFGQSVLNLAASQGGIFYSGLTSASLLAGTNAAGRILQSGNLGAPTWSVPTYPSTSGSAGQILSSDGTNVIYSTATFPVSAGAAGSILISDGTNIINSTSLWPNTVGTAGKIIRSDGTINTYTTSTFADTYAVSTLLYASSANTVSGLATNNNSVLVTSSTGVPSLSTTLPSGLVIPGYQPTITAAALTSSNDTNVTITLGGTPATALLQATSLTLGWTGTLSGTRGGTGVNNGSSTITIGGNLTFSGAFTTTFTVTANTSVTLPTTGTLASLSVNNTFTKRQAVTPVSISSSGGSTPTDGSASNYFTTTLTENTTLANPTNLVAGTWYTWIITQNASAAKTVALDTLFVLVGAAWIMTTTLSAKAVLSGFYDGTSILYSATQA